jgi:hypothetical protein
MEKEGEHTEKQWDERKGWVIDAGNRFGGEEFEFKRVNPWFLLSVTAK